MSSGSAEFLALVCLLGAVYCIGGLHGLWLAWSQEARMWRWAGFVHRHVMALVEREERKLS